jgi:hypothetical protein
MLILSIEWYKVTCHEDFILLDVAPPNNEPWTEKIYWNEIIRVCYKLGDLLEPDEMYIFIKGREPSYLISTEAIGGSELWGRIVGKNLFDPTYAIDMMLQSEGLYCWSKEN